MNICRNKGDVVKLYCIPQFIEFAKKLAVKMSCMCGLAYSN